VKVKIAAFQNDVNLGQTVTLAATNGYVSGVYNSRDQVWQVNVEDRAAADSRTDSNRAQDLPDLSGGDVRKHINGAVTVSITCSLGRVSTKVAGSTERYR
jgi:hypothetical protein